MSEQIERSNSFEEISKTIGDFLKKYQKDKRSQKAVTEKSIKKLKKKKPNYKDFSEQIVIWREQGHSYSQICRLLQAQTGIKTSDQTIARFFKRRNNEQKN